MDGIKRYSSLSFPKLIFKCFLFTVTFFLIALTVLLISSAFCYNTTDPTSKLEFIGICALYISTVISSFLMTKSNKEKWFFGGLLLGGMIFLSTLMISLPLGTTFSSRSLMLRIAIPFVSVATAYLGRKKSPKKKKFKHKIKTS